ncbi:hypothetical protein Golomagni_05290 [Golovinomyces magnicellulatus]|nr:hypothetical protein Golomagni_05290 [Golovinomyces magnicellulatus]
MDKLDWTNHMIVVLQEPSIKKRTLSTYCPSGFTLCMEPSKETKVPFLVNKSINKESWTYRWRSKYVAEITLYLNNQRTKIINVYSPPTNGQKLIGWDDIAEAVREDNPICILLGDFNCHHLSWGGLTATRDSRAQSLFNITAQFCLQLATPPNIPKYRKRVRGGQLSETDIIKRLRHCITLESWCIRQDHIPIEICLYVNANLMKNWTSYTHHRADIDKMKKHLQDSNWYLSSSSMVTLRNTIKEALKLYCPCTNPSPYAQAACFTRATELLKDTLRARRQALASGTEIDYARHKLLCRELKIETRYIHRVSWR